MKKQKKLVVGNWKMNPLTLDEAKHIAGAGKRTSLNLKKTQVVLCPPFIYISTLQNVPSTNIFLGSQDAFYEPQGSFTGEVSFATLRQFKVKYVIVGHSERRAAGESDETIQKKMRSVVTEGMTAILCVGEKVRDPHGEYLNIVRNQIALALREVPKKFLGNLVIAYEPVWAIGATEAMRPREIHEMSIFIKKVLHELYGVASDDVRILYGGAVDTTNADEIVREGNVSGLLIGRQSLKPKEFSEIIKLVDSI